MTELQTYEAARAARDACGVASEAFNAARQADEATRHSYAASDTDRSAARDALRVAKVNYVALIEAAYAAYFAAAARAARDATAAALDAAGGE